MKIEFNESNVTDHIVAEKNLDEKKIKEIADILHGLSQNDVIYHLLTAKKHIDSTANYTLQ